LSSASKSCFCRTGHRQQLAPAVGDPAAIIEAIGRGNRNFAVRNILIAQGRQQIRQCIDGILQFVRHRYRQIVGQRCHAGHPQTVFHLLAGDNAKAAGAAAGYFQQAIDRR